MRVQVVENHSDFDCLRILMSDLLQMLGKLSFASSAEHINQAFSRQRFNACQQRTRAFFLVS